MAKENENGFTEAVAAVTAEVKSLHEGFQKALAEERKTYDELLAKKANDEAVSELKAKLEKVEADATALQKSYDEEIAKLKMSASNAKATDQEQEFKEDFFTFMRSGSISAIPDARKEAFVDGMYKSYSACGDSRKSRDEYKAMFSGNALAGGSLVVPPFLEAGVDKFMRETVALYDMASQTTVSSPSYKRDARISRAGALWEGEMDTWTATGTPNYGQIEIKVHKLIAMPTISRDMIEDGKLNMEAEVMDFTQEAFSDAIALSLVSGNGIRQPQGLLSYPTIAEAKVADNWGKLGFVVSGSNSGFVADPAAADCLINLQGVLKSAYGSRAVWLMNRTVGTAVRKFKDSEGNYLWQPSFVAGQPPMMLGAPVRYDENMPDIAENAFPVAYGDFTTALRIVNRRGMTVIRDDLSIPGQVKFNIDRRLGAGLVNFEAIKLLKIKAS